MLSFIADENFNIHIVNGVLRRLPTADIVRVQDAGLEAFGITKGSESRLAR